MSYMKDVRGSAVGNTSLLRKYGGSGEPRQSYATGGAVKGYAHGGNPALSEGMAASGAPAKPSLARASRKSGKGKGKSGAKTHVNVIVAPQPPASAGPPPPPPGPMAGPPPPPPGPPGGGMMPPAGPPGPPMMRAKGGRVMDEAQDKTMIKKAVHAHDKQMHGGKGLTKLKLRDGGMMCRADGGSVHGLTNSQGGGGGARGRLAKIKMYGK
jgi:hypothetical protein